MPEGDTIFRLARRLGRALTGQTILSSRSQVSSIDAESLIGRVVESVESRGKSLLIHLDDARVVHTHMKMVGSWSVYLRGER